MADTAAGTVAVPGARLYYQLRGRGPMLLILQGGDGDAGATDPLVDHLADRYTVLTYDRRGLSRSTIEDRGGGVNLTTHGEDVNHLLAELATGPALVFGGSIGALVGLDLLTRHPERVHTVIAHEPPATCLLGEPERSEAERIHAEMTHNYDLHGAGAALRSFMTALGVDVHDREPGVRHRNRPSSGAPTWTSFSLMTSRRYGATDLTCQP